MSDLDTQTADVPDAPKSGRPTRRGFITGGVVAGAVVAGGAYALLSDDGPSVGTKLRANKVSKLPVDDPGSSTWGEAGSVLLELEMQQTTTPMKAEGGITKVEVEALHDGESIAFRMQWDDPDRDDRAIAVDAWRDACAVLLSRAPIEGQRLMGSADEPVSILHWKADWQRDIDEGFQDLEAQFPNASYGFYPPLVGIDGAPHPKDYVDAKAENWLVGLAAGNALAPDGRKSPVEKLRANGFGTLQSEDTQNAVGRGEWKDGRWRVVLARKLERTDPDEVQINDGAVLGLAAAVWLGDENDGGARKSLSKVIATLELK